MIEKTKVDALIVAAVDDDDRLLERLLAGLTIEELASLRRLLVTIGTLAANAEGRQRSEARRRRGSWL